MRTVILFLFLIVIMTSCKKDNSIDFQELEITTNTISEITPFSAKSGGEMSNTSGKTISNKGVCWSTVSNPTLEDSSQWNSVNANSYLTNLYNLDNNTTYYVRAYAVYETTEEISIQKTVYGNELSFTTHDLIADSNIVEYVSVVGGTYLMGSIDGEADELPVHTVTVSDFKISKYEITNEQYCVFLNDICCPSTGFYLDEIYGEVKYINAGSEVSSYQIQYDNALDLFVPKNGLDNYPVINVSWHGANAFAKWAGGGRLPTEAEWEFAARGGNNSNNNTYSGSNIIYEVAWYTDNSGEEGHSNIWLGGGTMEVGRKAANELGIYDMSGNVWEFCNDWYVEDYYENSPEVNPQGAANGFNKVKRGGSWRDHSFYIRVANRGYHNPNFNDPDLLKGIGFRPVLIELLNN